MNILDESLVRVHATTSGTALQLIASPLLSFELPLTNPPHSSASTSIFQTEPSWDTNTFNNSSSITKSDYNEAILSKRRLVWKNFDEKHIQLTFQASDRHAYKLEVTEDLVQGNWRDAGLNGTLDSEHNQWQWEFRSASTSACSFYRVVQVK